MKKFVTVLLLCLAFLLVATPLLADRPAPVGGRINVLFSTPDTYPAGAPFHIQHGWLTAPKDAPPGNFDFQLEMDGVYQSHDFYSVVGGQDALSITWLFNYPDGMSGVRTFTGHWFAPCQYAVELGMYPGPCPSPNMPVEAYSRTLTVTFTP